MHQRSHHHGPSIPSIRAFVDRSPPRLESKGFDTVEVLLASVLPVDSRVDIHRLACRVTTDVPKDVLLHPLVPHQRGEHGPIGMRCDLLMEPIFSTLHHTRFDSGINQL